MKCKGEGFKFCFDLKRMQKQSGTTSPSKAEFVDSGGCIRRNSRSMAVHGFAIHESPCSNARSTPRFTLLRSPTPGIAREHSCDSLDSFKRVSFKGHRSPTDFAKRIRFAFSLKSIQPFGRSVLRLRIDEVKGLASFITLQKLADFLRHGRFLESNLTSRTFRTFLAICFNGMIALIPRAFVGQTTV